METEDFDDAFRGNINRAEHDDVSDNEVENIINYVNRKRSTSNKKPYLFYGGLTFMLAAIAGLLTWNIVQMQENRSLVNTINSYNNQGTTNFSNKKIPVNRDTIYIKEYVQSAGNLREISEEKKTISSQNKLMTFVKNDSKTNNTINEISVTNNIRKSTKIVVNKTPSAKSKTNKKSPTYSALYSSNINDGNITSSEYIKKKDNFVLSTDYSFSNDLTFQTLHSGDSITDQPIKSKLYCRNFSYQVGLGTNIVDDQKSVSILMGINLNDHWNISTGINLLKINNYNYNDKDDFHYYSNLKTVTDTSLITFVGVKQTIYQVPVTFSYLISLTKSFSLVFGAGTDLDIYASQDFSYKLNTNQEEKNMTKKSPVLVFNNAVLSVGLNTEWQHFLLQLSPFINPQITRVSYKNPESYYGGRIRIFYKF